MTTNKKTLLKQKIMGLIEEFENRQLSEHNKIKAQESGIAYTPRIIVEKMVNKVLLSYIGIPYSVAPLEEIINKTHLNEFLLNKIENITILDPSCGTGRFLIATANLLLIMFKLISSDRSESELKKDILEKSLFGVEIDKETASIARLRLICWYLSDSAEIPRELEFINSDTISAEKILKIIGIHLNIYEFDFLTEFKNDKKFDIIIGNPPYIENKKNKNFQYKKQLSKLYRSAYKLFDLSVLFIEKALLIVKREGFVSYILPNKFLSADYGVRIREFILKNVQVEEIANISSLGVFGKKAAYPIILYLKNTASHQNYSVKLCNYDSLLQFDHENGSNIKMVDIGLIKKLPKWVFPISGNLSMVEQVFSKYNSLNEIFPDLKIIYRPFGFLNWSKNLDNIAENKSSPKDMILLGTGNVGKYHFVFDKKIRIARKELIPSYYRFENKFEDIWQEMAQKKLVFREIARELTFVYDPGIFTNVTGLYFLLVPSLSNDQLFSLLTILNSTLMNELYNALYGTLHMSGGYMRYNGSFIKHLPLPFDFPISLSRLGKILQFLSQLEYDLKPLTTPSLSLDVFKPKLGDYKIFFKRLADSLVYMLYFQEDFNDEYTELKRVFASGNTLPDIKFNFFVNRFEFDCFKSIESRKLYNLLDQIRTTYNCLNTKQIGSEMKLLAKNY
ncbi:MAG: N-6 DNA methylase [Candidatus Lokiarchaeota archaeon]|nr:N-6 DNA methylase [Candidatus Lokiarchaeota archaeon]